jgi:hypothetical protein
MRSVVSAWKQFVIRKVLANAIVCFPVHGTSTSPALFQLANNFDIAPASIFTGSEVSVKAVDKVTKVDSEFENRHEVVDEIVQDPMAEGYECAYSDNASKVILSIDRPP